MNEWSEYYNRHKNGIWVTLCVFIGFGLGVYFLLQQPVDAEVAFVPDESYYIPISQVERKANAQNEAYSTYVSMRNIECPGVTTNVTPKGATIATNGVYAGRKSQIRFTHFLFTKEEMYSGNDTGHNSISRGSIGQVLSLNLNKTPIAGLTFSEMLSVSPSFKADSTGVEQCYEIISPFAYTFDNCNMDDERGKIVILNSNKSVRITIENIANWFCAGVPGTTMKTDSRVSEGDVSWSGHDSKHLSWVGHHNNSKKTSGGSGELLGYGNAATKFTIEQYYVNEWVPISWETIYDL